MYSYDLTTNEGLIRLNTFQQLDAADPLFQDEELAALYTQEGHVKLAAARVLEIVAQREVWVQKVIKLLSLSTNGAAVAAELRAQAQTLRDQVVTAADATGNFDIAEWVVNDFGARERIDNEILRGF